MCPINKLVYPGGFLSGQFPSKSVYPTTSFGKCTHHNCLYIWPEFTLEKKRKEREWFKLNWLFDKHPLLSKCQTLGKLSVFCGVLWMCVYISLLYYLLSLFLFGRPPASLQPLNTLSTSLFLPGLFREMSVSLYRNQSRIFLPAFSH